MLDQWLLVQDHYLLTPLYHIFKPIERGYMSEGSQEGVYATPDMDPSEHTVNIGGIDYNSEITETDRVSTFTGLDDYDTLFAGRHGRGALDPVPKVGEQITMTPLGIPPPMAGPELINPMERVMPIHGDVHSGQREQVSLYTWDFETASRFT